MLFWAVRPSPRPQQPFQITTTGTGRSRPTRRTPKRWCLRSHHSWYARCLHRNWCRLTHWKWPSYYGNSYSNGMSSHNRNFGSGNL